MDNYAFGVHFYVCTETEKVYIEMS